MTWITLFTTSTRWQAELMQQLLAAHDIQTRIIDLGVSCFFGSGTPTALLLLSPLEEEQDT